MPADAELEAAYLEAASGPPSVLGRVRPPDLANRSKFHRESAIPTLIPCIRERRRNITDPSAPGGVRVEAEVIVYDLAMLKKVAANTQARCERGDPALIIIGHRSNEPDSPESSHPPLVGFATGFAVGVYGGKPAVLADYFIKVDQLELAGTYPRRSPEIVLHNDGGYIDAIALIRTVPHNDMGMLTFSRQGDSPNRSLIDFDRNIAGLSRLSLDMDKVAVARARLTSEYPNNAKLRGLIVEYMVRNRTKDSNEAWAAVRHTL